MLKFLKSFKIMKLNPDDVVLKLVPSGEPVKYGDVLGFFKFRDTLYYREKGRPGKSIFDAEVSFTESIKATYPTEFSDILAKDVGKIIVQPYVISK